MGAKVSYLDYSSNQNKKKRASGKDDGFRKGLTINPYFKSRDNQKEPGEVPQYVHKTQKN
jgi:hypothetical protein